MEQAAFLARLREQLACPVGPPLSAHEHGEAAPATAAFRRSLADPAGAFTEEATALGVAVRRVPAGGLPAFLDEVVATHGVRRAVVSRDPEVVEVGAHLAACGVAVGEGREAAAAADLGVTGAAFGIAATGSLVVAADRAGSRLASLLPPVHAALLRVDRLLATPADFFPRLDEHFPAGVPSQVVVITGPSRTADIELVLVRGVHGPGHLWVGLLDAE